MKYNIFEENLKEALEAEEMLRPKLKEILMIKTLKQIKWREHPNLQKEGIDAKLQQKTANVEIKARSNEAYKKYHDILIETETYGNPGWFYYTEADLVAYVWWNKRKTNFIREGYLIVILPQLREWFDRNKQNFSEKKAYSKSETGTTWVTKNRAVPMNKFPKDSLVRFNPHLDRSEQKQLMKYFKTE